VWVVIYTFRPFYWKKESLICTGWKDMSYSAGNWTSIPRSCDPSAQYIYSHVRLNAYHIVCQLSGKISSVMLLCNSNALNSCKCPPGVNFTSGESGREGVQRRKGMSSLQRREEPPVPPPSICLYSHESISLEKTSWKTEAPWISFMICSLLPVITPGVPNQHFTTLTYDATDRSWIRNTVIISCVMILCGKCIVVCTFI
jgi:hypothetical protein